MAALVLLLACAGARPAGAHRLDESHVSHLQMCRLTRSAFTVDYRVVVGGLIANRCWAVMDADGDQALSDAEQDTFAGELARNLHVSLDGVDLSTRLAQKQFPSREEFFTGSFPYIQVVIDVRLPREASPGPHDIRIVNNNLRDFTPVFPRVLVAAAPETHATVPTTPDGGRTTEFGFWVPDRSARPSELGGGVSGRLGARTSPPAPSPAKAGGEGEREKETRLAPPRHPLLTERGQGGSAAWGAGGPRPLSAADTQLRLPQQLSPGAAGERDAPAPRTTNDGKKSLSTSLQPLQLTPSGGLIPESQPVLAAESTPILQHSQPLKDALRRPLSLGALVLALGVAVLLGMGHALTPGHGKTVVAAYLVGSRGTVWDAVFLGSVVTLTHTGSVLVLGTALLLASKYVVPEAVFPWLGVVSGAIIVGMGFWMLIRGILSLYGVIEPHSHAHGPGPSHRHSHGWLGGSAGSEAGATEHAHSHDDEGASSHNHAHSHSHGHGHDHEHAHAHGQLHDHGQGHSHSHGHAHSHEPPHANGPAGSRRASRWGLLSLGVAGGMVPCPDAIVVLLAAVAMRRLALGLGLIVAFSFGLAAVLIGIGVLMVTARSWMARWTGEGRLLRLLPVISGAAILVLGFVIAVQSLVAAQVIQIRV